MLQSEETYSSCSTSCAFFISYNLELFIFKVFEFKQVLTPLILIWTIKPDNSAFISISKELCMFFSNLIHTVHLVSRNYYNSSFLLLTEVIVPVTKCIKSFR